MNESENNVPASNRADLEDSLKIRVLLVDDSKAFRHVASDFLQRQRELIVIGAICGGKEALTQSQDLEPNVFLVDLARPSLETVSRIRRVLPGVSIIALTLLNDTAYRRAALAAGADDVVSKAALITDLMPAIQRVTQAKLSR